MPHARSSQRLISAGSRPIRFRNSGLRFSPILSGGSGPRFSPILSGDSGPRFCPILSGDSGSRFSPILSGGSGPRFSPILSGSSGPRFSSSLSGSFSAVTTYSFFPFPAGSDSCLPFLFPRRPRPVSSASLSQTASPAGRSESFQPLFLKF